MVRGVLTEDDVLDGVADLVPMVSSSACSTTAPGCCRRTPDPSRQPRGRHEAGRDPVRRRADSAQPRPAHRRARRDQHLGSRHLGQLALPVLRGQPPPGLRPGHGLGHAPRQSRRAIPFAGGPARRGRCGWWRTAAAAVRGFNRLTEGPATPERLPEAWQRMRASGATGTARAARRRTPVAGELSRPEYAARYGPTTGDRIRLGDTNLILESSATRRATATRC